MEEIILIQIVVILCLIILFLITIGLKMLFKLVKYINFAIDRINDLNRKFIDMDLKLSYIREQYNEKKKENNHE